MSEDFHKFKEDIEQIEIPAIELQHAVYYAVSKAEAEKRVARKWWYKGAIVSTIGIAILSLLVLFSQMGEMEHKSFSPELADGVQKSLVQEKKEATPGNEDLQVREIIYDEERLEITYEIPLDSEANAPAIEKRIYGCMRAVLN
ncbi:hypothetical protein ACFQDF_14535 [Ectobacillus funiculus]